MKISDCLKKVDTDKISHHRYGEAYDELFSSFDRDGYWNIFEIGTQKGGSLLAWKEYFPKANVMGIDIVDVVPEKYRLDTVTRFIGDIKDFRTDLKFDIVIDDGSHYLADLVYVVSEYVHKLNKGGMLILEDIRYPSLMVKVIENLFLEIKLGFPECEDVSFDTKVFDNRTKETPQSFMLVLIKE